MSPTPITTPKGAAIQLTQEDLGLLDNIHLKSGGGSTRDYVMHKMCIMQACMLLTLPPDVSEHILHGGDIPEKYRNEEDDDSTLGWYPICVSVSIAEYLVSVNDAIKDDKERDKLLDIIPEIMNTCPVKRRVYPSGTVSEQRRSNRQYQKAEEKRYKILEEAPADQRDIPLEQKLEAVRRAANVYRTAPALPPGETNANENNGGSTQPQDSNPNGITES